jgi:CRP-like cAMP-binding protein
MTFQARERTNKTDCALCPLRRLAIFVPFSDHTLAFMRAFKIGELNVMPGTTMMMEGSSSPQLYTVLRGMGLRFKTLEGGQRQVVNFVLPGDFLGLQAAVMGEMKHSISASTEMVLCTFDRGALWDLFRHEPKRAFDLTWLGAVEEHFLGEALASVGQRPGIDRLGWALLRLYTRLADLGLRQGDSVPLPYRQQDMADALGLSLVHTNKSLQKLRQERLVDWSQGRLTISDPARLAAFAKIQPEADERRPLM